MRLSGLQKYILKKGLDKKKLEKVKILEFYKNKKKQPNSKDQQTIIYKSAIKLIDQGLLVGYGRRTREKWFFQYFKLTAKGKAKALDLIKQRQQKLPFKK